MDWLIMRNGQTVLAEIVICNWQNVSIYLYPLASKIHKEFYCKCYLIGCTICERSSISNSPPSFLLFDYNHSHSILLYIIVCCEVNVTLHCSYSPRNVTLYWNTFYLNKCVHEGFEITLFFNILHIHLVTIYDRVCGSLTL